MPISTVLSGQDSFTKAQKWMQNIAAHSEICLDAMAIEEKMGHVSHSPLLYERRQEMALLILVALDKLSEYEKLGTVEDIQDALQKQDEMEVTDIHVDEYYCPACGAENNCDGGKVGDHFCPACGQKYKEDTYGY